MLPADGSRMEKKKAHKYEIVDKRTVISNSLVSLADFDYAR